MSCATAEADEGAMATTEPFTETGRSFLTNRSTYLEPCTRKPLWLCSTPRFKCDDLPSSPYVLLSAISLLTHAVIPVQAEDPLKQFKRELGKLKAHLVAGGVLVLHLAREHDGARLEAAVRVRRESGGRPAGRQPHLVQHQEWVQIPQRPCSHRPADAHSRTWSRNRISAHQSSNTIILTGLTLN